MLEGIKSELKIDPLDCANEFKAELKAIGIDVKADGQYIDVQGVMSIIWLSDGFKVIVDGITPIAYVAMRIATDIVDARDKELKDKISRAAKRADSFDCEVEEPELLSEEESDDDDWEWI